MLAAAAAYYWHRIPSVVTIGVDQRTVHFVRNVTCLTPYIFHRNNCARVVLDGLFDGVDVAALKELAQRGMAARPSIGGPTILDLNTGYLRDTNGLVNLFQDQSSDIFKKKDFELYERMIQKLKRHVESTFGTEDIYFTAPTFVTRLDGRASWSPKGI